MDSLKKAERLKNSLRIGEIKKSGKSFSCRLLVIVFAKNQLDFNRIAVIASKSVGGAVQRNRCKRILRSRVARFGCQVKTGFDILLIARVPLLKATPIEIDEAFLQLLKEADLV